MVPERSNLETRTRNTVRRPALATVLLAAAACKPDYTPEERVEPSFVTVSTEATLGSEKEPMDFSPEAQTATFTVQTLDKDGQSYPLNGDLTVRVRPGRLSMDPKITIENGVWTGDVTWEAAFGPARFWFGDEGDKDIDSGRPAGWATGVSPIFHFVIPTIAQMQEIDDPETNQLAGEFAELEIAERQVVVTEIATDGFWATDLLDGADSYGSIYVYTFGKPEGVVAGTRLLGLDGSVQEYLGTTQLSFPNYTGSDTETLMVPDAIALEGVTGLCDGSDVNSNAAEALEASRVSLTGAKIPASFTSESEEYLDYIEYGQWPIETSMGCTLYISTGTAVIGLDPLEWAGAEIPSVSGMLTQIWSQWIITITDADDIQITGFSSDKTTTTATGSASSRTPATRAVTERGRPLPRPAP